MRAEVQAARLAGLEFVGGKREWQVIDSAPTPEDDGTIELVKKGREFVICVDGRELMGNVAHRSEDALAELACSYLDERPAPRVLVGGLGLGFTLNAALQHLGPDACVVVAELVPAIVEWNRGLLADLANRPLFDPRTEVHVGDVCEVLEAEAAAWDVILLDVDNGPKSLTKITNGWLYTQAGLETAHRALRPGGVLGVWSARPNNSFARRMGKVGFDVDTVEIEPRLGMLQKHVIWIGLRLDRPA